MVLDKPISSFSPETFLPAKRVVNNKERDLSDKELCEAFIIGESLPWYYIVDSSQEFESSCAQLELVFEQPYETNEANQILEEPSIEAEETLLQLHFGLAKIYGQHLGDNRMSTRQRAEAIRWFQQIDNPPPNWHPFTFMSYCWLSGSDPDILRKKLFRYARNCLRNTCPDES